MWGSNPPLLREHLGAVGPQPWPWAAGLGVGFVVRACLSLSYPSWWVLLTSFSRVALQLLGFFQRELFCVELESQGVWMGVGSGSPYGTPWNRNPLQLFCLWLKTLTGHPDWRGTDLRGWEELPAAPPSPHLQVGLHCARQSARVHLRLAGGVRASGGSHWHTLLLSSFRSRHWEAGVLLAWESFRLGRCKAEKKSDSVFLERWQLNSPTVLQGPPEKLRRFLHWTSARWWSSVLGRWMAWSTSEFIFTCQSSLHPFIVNNSLTLLDPLDIDWIPQFYFLRGPCAPPSQHWPRFVTTHIGYWQHFL